MASYRGTDPVRYYVGNIPIEYVYRGNDLLCLWKDNPTWDEMGQYTWDQLEQGTWDQPLVWGM